MAGTVTIATAVCLSLCALELPVGAVTLLEYARKYILSGGGSSSPHVDWIRKVAIVVAATNTMTINMFSSCGVFYDAVRIQKHARTHTLLGQPSFLPKFLPGTSAGLAAM